MSSNDEIYAVLLAIDGDTLLLPNAVISEVLPAAVLEGVADGAFLGRRSWNDRVLQVLSFEALNNGTVPAENRRARSVVLHSTGTASYALLAQSYPHLVTLNRAALTPMPLRGSDNPAAVLSRVRIAKTEALIPNLETMEAEALRYAQMI